MHSFEKMFINVFYAPKYPNIDQFISSISNIAEFYQEDCLYIFIDIEKCPDLVKSFNLTIVPTIILSDANKKPLKIFENPQINELILNLDDDISLFKSNFQVEKERMFSKIDQILSISPIMVFIKGTPQEPKCGFTSSLLEILKTHELNFGYFNILENEDVRNWLRYYSKWNTYPQFYVNKNIIGGLDVIRDLISKGKFESLLPPNCRISINPEEKIKQILLECKDKIVVFVSSLLAEENKAVLEVLKGVGVKFVLHDCQKDEKIIEFLKGKEGNLPVCFVAGEYIGGLSKLKELCSKEDLLKRVPQTEWSLNAKQKLDFLMNNFKTICFIEGAFEDSPVNQRLQEIFLQNKIDFQYFNVNFDKELKDLLINLTEKNDFPQVFLKKKYVGSIETLEAYVANQEFNKIFS